MQKYDQVTRNTITVAGNSNGAPGSLYTELNQPYAIALDSNENIYIADTFNHRVVLWQRGTSNTSIVAGTGKNHSITIRKK